MEIAIHWKKVADEVVSNNWRSVLVLGAVDRGKSTFVRYLCSCLLQAGRRVALLDADIGQKDVGAPATISLGHVLTAGEELALYLADSYFIGDTSPANHLLAMLTGARKMFDAAGADCVVINTGGMIEGPGLALNTHLIELLQPDLIIGIERSRELNALLWPHRHHRIRRMPSSALARTKTAAERAENRRLAFAASLSGANMLVLPFGELVFQRGPVFNASPIQVPESLYAERTARELVMVMEQLPDRVPERTRILEVGFEKNLLCGLADAKNRLLGLGILQRIDFAAEEVHLLSAVAPERVAVLQFGNLYLDLAGRELGRFKTLEKKRRPGGRRGSR